MSEGTKKLKVIFLCGDKSGPWYHHIHLPSQFFRKYNLLECEDQFIVNQKQFETADIVHFQRQYIADSFFLTKKLKEMGKVCVFFCDDNVWEMPAHNPAQKTYGQPDVLYRYQEVMSQAHAVTVTTPYLKTKCEEFNPSVTVFRNLILPEITSFVSPGRDDEDEIRIGWYGTPHHHDDVALIDEACLKILYKYQKVKFVFMGYAPPSLKKYPRERFEYSSFVPSGRFYPCLASLDFDIGLIPLVDHPFNYGRTCLKFHEFGILQVPSIATSVGPYGDIPAEVISFVKNANSPKEWFNSMAWLIEHPEERKALGKRAHQYVLDNHSMHRFIFERAQYYYNIYAKVKGTERTIVWDGMPVNVN